MSCYHPFVGTFDGEWTDRGKKKYKINGFLSVKNLDDIESISPDHVLIPCGKCVGCRLDYSRQWADRMMLELETQKKAIFLTLTYDPEHIVDADGRHFPWMEDKDFNLGSLYKRHLQLFMKSIRKCFDRQGVKLRFYAVGEYGSWQNTHRPHYHVILFGVGIDDFINKIEIGFNELKQKIYTHVCISALWPHGFVSIGDVSWKSCAYVARYVTKKALDVESDLVNESLSLNPIFSVMSRKPGIGKEYLEQHPDCLDFQNIYLSTSDGALKVNIPKYYFNQLKLTDEDRFDKIMADRMIIAKDANYLKMSQTDLDFNEVLENEEKNKISQIKSLHRYV